MSSVDVVDDNDDELAGLTEEQRAELARVLGDEEPAAPAADEGEGEGEDHRRPLTVSLITARCLPVQVLAKDPAAVAEAAFVLKTLHLDRMDVSHIDDLELFHEVTHLYLQYNRIRTLENVGLALRHLRFLVLRGNRLTRLGTDLAPCRKLAFLDVSENLLEDVTDEEVHALPVSLQMLNVRENPLRDAADARARLLARLPALVEFNKAPVQPRVERDGTRRHASQRDLDSADVSQAVGLMRSHTSEMLDQMRAGVPAAADGKEDSYSEDEDSSDDSSRRK